MSDFKKQVIRGYELQEQLGVGGFGAVYRAYQPLLKREVAIKVILPHLANNPEFIRRFEVEAELVARLEHPHIVPLFDYWRDPDGAYLVMRYLRGGSLRDVLDEGKLSPQRTLEIFEQITQALNIAHRNGVVHRDIKPANMLLDEDGNVYLTDFGIAKTDKYESQTGDGISGSIPYLSPEQIQEGNITPQTDIYALGVMLYEVLTGKHPFDAKTITDFLLMHIQNPIPDITLVDDTLPYEVNEVIQQASAKDARERFANVRDLANALRNALSDDVSESLSLTGNFDDKYATFIQLPNPYKGLRAFQEADSEQFFGRFALVESLLGRLSEDHAQARFLAIVGPSGSGKSSVVKAGLLPALRAGALPDSDKWFITEMFPGSHPFAELEASLIRVASNPADSLLSLLKEEDGLTRTVKRILPDDETELVLVIDQFEELFTLVEDEQIRQRFLDNLMSVVKDTRSRIWVIATLRADFYDKPLHYHGFGDVFRNRMETVLPLTPEELTESIRQPAEQVGAKFQSGLIETIVKDVSGQSSMLPLLQYALTELFERRSGITMTLEAYRDIGGVTGALARRAEELYQEMDEKTQNATRQLFLRLITLGEGTEDTRRRVRQTDLPDNERLQHVLERFGKYRLLTFDHDAETRQPTIEVAHEAILREWDRLHQWLNESRDDIRQERAVSRAAEDWQSHRHDVSFLLRGARLEQVEKWQQTSQLSQTALEKSFIEASLKQRSAEQSTELERQEREKRLERRSRNFLIGLLTVFLLATILSGTLAIIARQNEETATDNAEESLSLALASGAQFALSNGNVEQAIALAMQANQAETPPIYSQRTLFEVATAPGTAKIINGGEGWRWSLDISHDGTMLAYSEDEMRGAILDIATGERIITVGGNHPEGHSQIVFTPDDTQVLLGFWDDTLELWRIDTGEMVWQAINPAGDPNSIAISPDGTMAVVGSEGGVATLWNMETGELIGTFEGHIAEQEVDGEIYPVQVQGTDFSPDGRLVATASEDTTVYIWDVETLEPVHHLQGHDALVFSVAFSPDGKLLASTSFDQSVILWDVETGELRERLQGHSDFVFGVAFSPDGKRLLSTSRDATMILWDVAQAIPLKTYKDGTGRILSVEFLDNTQAITGSSSGDMRLWLLDDAYIRQNFSFDEPINSMTLSADQGTAFLGAVDAVLMVNAETGNLLHRFEFEGGQVTALVLSPSGEVIFAGFEDGSVVEWEIETANIVRQFAGQEPYIAGNGQIFGNITDLAVSPDGEQLIASAENFMALVWDSESGDIVHTFDNCSDTINTVAFSPDGQTIAGGFGTLKEPIVGTCDGQDFSIHLWNASTGELIQQFEGHEDAVTQVRFCDDNQYLVSGSVDETLRLWDSQTGEQLRIFEGHTGVISHIQCDIANNRIVSSTEEGELIVWDTSTGDVLRRIDSHDEMMTGLQTSGNDGDVWVSFANGQLSQWMTLPVLDQLLSWTQDNRFVPELTCEQRSLYHIEPLCDG